jgi:hypothetical protein
MNSSGDIALKVGENKKSVSKPENIATRRIGSDELNLAEFPLGSIGRDKSETGNSLFFKDRIYDEGAKTHVDRELIVTGSEHFGLPTSADSDILIVLMYLTHQRNGFTDRTLRFSRYELVKILGIPDSGASYKRIDESLQRWVSVTLHYKRSWWSRKDLNWQNKSFHILESVDLVGRSSKSGDIQSSITWNSVIMESVQSSYVKRLDLETYFSLNLPSARQAYRFLDKRFYKQKNLVFDLKSFACEHVGLSRNYDCGKLKAKLEPCLVELEEVGFLKRMPKEDRYIKVKAGEWKIRLSRATNSNELDGTCEPASTDQLAVKDLLITRGVSEQGALELTAQYSLTSIKEAIAYVDWLSTQPKNKPKKIPAFLVCAIRDRYLIPESFRKNQSQSSVNSGRIFTKASPIQKNAGQKPEVSKMPSPDFAQEESKAVQSYLQGLSKEDASSFEKAAMASANRFSIQTYKRLQKNNDSLASAVRTQIMIDHYRKL